MLIALHDIQLIIFALLGGMSGFIAALNFR
ncbi:hypothetical protein [Vibrio phage VP24-2_Ke]|uniref:Uncharacterized protein n=4 Tax=Fibrovirus TaxID=1977139 RepID=O56835_9VIRU|nr:hypothetical protein fs1p02 [Fibrovirus fs1]NP_835476.1 hypothetical protein VGJphip05 [Vibrio phage VGJ]YP_002925192.1 putative minor capsid protein [Vibrio phage VEJ]YP_010768547.1 hypothetical protein QII03_gp09 [Vibrio phage VP24-2_Ke]AAO93100.1 hypothetical protein [Vibrio phage VGJ]ACQ44542.1 putative minor capsid protein [Vibrio phage VEJ]QGM12448.1 hypothetical protein [Vibrio phage VP24-2_Ke]BAA24162.1 hypothetical protein [Fibrovirus fs1]